MPRFVQLTIAILVPLAFGSVTAQSLSAETDAIRAANHSYYAALSARDLRAMEQAWSQSSDDVNIAPPTRPVAHVGWAEVKRNYETFWPTLDELTVSMEHPTIRIEGNVAWVYGTERVKRRTKDGQVSSGTNFGTSIFVKQNERWLLVFHQAAVMPQHSH